MYKYTGFVSPTTDSPTLTSMSNWFTRTVDSRPGLDTVFYIQKRLIDINSYRLTAHNQDAVAVVAKYGEG